MAEKIRLQKFLSDAGILSRRAAEAEISKGAITINGHVATLGAKVDPKSDVIAWKGKRIHAKAQKPVYILMNKPRGYLCAVSDERGRKCVTELLVGVKERVYPVGRLDLISEGILLLTNDGELTNRLTHPSYEIPKLYRVKVEGSVSADQLNILSSSLDIDGYRIRPATVDIHNIGEEDTTLSITICEGRNRQIRKMCEQAGLTVKRLNRISIGQLKLNGLPVGKWRYLDPKEIEYLYRTTHLKTK
ncbi:MAG: rRNA pseudouridine synthase [Clostridia bacterium]|nr:rRNA pseudouridine synthase [Clostridia bacterium]